MSEPIVPGDTPRGQHDERRTDEEAERLLLAAFMRGGIAESGKEIGALSPEMFAVYPQVARKILALWDEDYQPDPETLGSEGVEIPDAVRHASPPVINIERFAHRVRIAHLSRTIGHELADLAEDAFKGHDPEKLLADLEHLAIDLSKNSTPIELKRVSEYLSDVLDDIGQEEGEEVTGISTGLYGVDQITRGWQDGDLVYIAGRPSMGKSSLALQAFAHAAKQGHSVGFISAEMRPSRFVPRLLFQEARVSSQKRTEYTSSEWDRLRRAADTLSGLDFYVTEQSSITIHELREIFRRLVLEEDCDLVCFDYIQLLTLPSDSTHQHKNTYLSEASKALKAEAKSLGVPVVILSQLNRDVEKSGGMKRPKLKHLRNSGSMEQDADLVAFVYRAERYDIPRDDNGRDLTGIAEIIVGKNRNGPIGTAYAAWVPQFTRFESLSQDSPFPQYSFKDSR